MSIYDVATTVLLLSGLFVVAAGIAVISEWWVLWRRRRAIRRIQQEQDRERFAWQSTGWGGDY